MTRTGAGTTALLDRLPASALLVIASSDRDPDLAPFVGRVHLGESALVVTRSGGGFLAHFSPLDRGEAARTGLAPLDPELLGVTAARRQEGEGAALALILERALAFAGVLPGPVALAGRRGSGVVFEACRALERRGFRFASGNELLRVLRKRKTEDELAEVRAAAGGASAALRRLAALLAQAEPRTGELWLGGERLRTRRLRAEVAVVLAGLGLEQPEGNLLVAGGEGAVPHNTGADDRVLRQGESLVVDLFPKGRLFADTTRTFCVGKPSPALAAAHAAVRSVLEEAHRRVVPGVTGVVLQQAACAAFEAAGYPTIDKSPGTERGYVHGLGHGVGFELHELPSFRAATSSPFDGHEVLAPGDVLTLEPGLYDAAADYAVRLEDLCAVRADGTLENLTPLPYALDPRAWG